MRREPKVLLIISTAGGGGGGGGGIIPAMRGRDVKCLLRCHWEPLRGQINMLRSLQPPPLNFLMRTIKVLESKTRTFPVFVPCPVGLVGPGSGEADCIIIVMLVPTKLKALSSQSDGGHPPL